MNRLQKQKKSIKKILLISGGIALLIAGTIGAMALTSTGPFSKTGTTNDSSTNTSSSTDESDQTPVTDPGNQKEDEPTEKTPTNNQPTDEPEKDTLVASITAANQGDSTFQVRTLIESVDTSGTCSLTATKGTKKITKSSGIQALASSSTCKGFDIPLSELSNGEWKLSITINASSKKATLTKVIEIK